MIAAVADRQVTQRRRDPIGDGLAVDVALERLSHRLRTRAGATYSRAAGALAGGSTHQSRRALEQLA